MTASIDREQVLHVARLARLTLGDDEVAPLTAQLVKISFDHVAKLAEVDVTGVEPTAQVGVDRMPLRPDEPRPSLSRDRVLSMASETASGGFVVPAFIEE